MKEKIVLFQIACLALIVFITPAASEYLGESLPGRLFKLIMIPTTIIFFPDFVRYSTKLEKSYIIMMVLAFITHLFVKLENKNTNPFWESFTWISIVYLLVLSKKYNSCKLIMLAMFVFYFMECSVAIFEKISMTSFVKWSDKNVFFGRAELYDYSSEFRSTAFLRHALNNANVVSIFLSFILCAKNISRKYKYFLLALGLLALWAFNSRGAMIMWMLIIVYWIFFKNKNIVLVSLSGLAAYIALPFVLDFIANNEIFGRLSEGVEDGSTQTRLDAFMFFAMHQWNTTNILFGGDIIYMPGSILSLENGVLLNLGYWGWIIGSLKTIMEVVISYKLLPADFDAKTKMIIMAACWGVAFMNNNSFQPLVFSYFMFVNIAFRNIDNQKTRGRDNTNNMLPQIA